MVATVEEVVVRLSIMGQTRGNYLPWLAIVQSDLVRLMVA